MTRIVLITGLFCIFVLGGCTPPNQTGSVDYESIDSQKARLLKEIDKKYENPEAHYQLGKLYHQDRMYNRAEWQYRIALQFDPVHYRAMAALVRLLRDSDKTQEAAMAADMYLRQASTTAKASTLLGKAFQNENMDEYALECYQQALTMAPNSAALHRQIGFYYAGVGDQILAEEYLRRSIQLDPYQPEVAEQLGRMGVVVQIPRKIEQDAESVDESLEQEQ